MTYMYACNCMIINLMHICVCIDMYVCVYIYTLCVYIHIYIYLYTHTQKFAVSRMGMTHNSTWHACSRRLPFRQVSVQDYSSAHTRWYLDQGSAWHACSSVCDDCWRVLLLPWRWDWRDLPCAVAVGQPHCRGGADQQDAAPRPHQGLPLPHGMPGDYFGMPQHFVAVFSPFYCRYSNIGNLHDLRTEFMSRSSQFMSRVSVKTILPVETIPFPQSSVSEVVALMHHSVRDSPTIILGSH